MLPSWRDLPGDFSFAAESALVAPFALDVPGHSPGRRAWVKMRTERKRGGGRQSCQQPGRQAAVVAHSTLNKAVLSHALGKGLPRLGEVRQANCCINVLDVEHLPHADNALVRDAVLLLVAYSSYVFLFEFRL